MKLHLRIRAGAGPKARPCRDLNTRVRKPIKGEEDEVQPPNEPIDNRATSSSEQRTSLSTELSTHIGASCIVPTVSGPFGGSAQS